MSPKYGSGLKFCVGQDQNICAIEEINSIKTSQR